MLAPSTSWLAKREQSETHVTEITGDPHARKTWRSTFLGPTLILSLTPTKHKMRRRHHKDRRKDMNCSW